MTTRPGASGTIHGGHIDAAGGPRSPDRGGEAREAAPGVEAGLRARVRELEAERAGLIARCEIDARLFDRAPVGYAVLDRDGAIRAINEAGTQMLCGDGVEALGRPLADYFADPDPLADALSRLLGQGGRGSLTVRAPSGEGSRRHLRLVIDASDADPMPRVVMLDVSELVEAERALRDSQELFGQLAEQVNDVFWMIDAADLRSIYVSSSFEHIWGVPCRQYLEHRETWMDAIHPDDRPAVDAVFHPATHWDFDTEYRIVRPDGEIRWIRDRGFPVRDASGRIVRLAGIATDITASRRLQDQIQERQAQLAHLGRVAMAGEMASGLAHELNQPLAAVVSYAQICREMVREGTPAPERLGSALDRILDQGRRAGDIIRRLRGLMRKAEPRREACDVAELLEQGLRLARIESKWRQSSFRIEIEPGLPPVFADTVQVEQVVLNLVRNGIDAMGSENGGAPSIVLRAAAHGGGLVRVEVEDRGQGLDSRQVESIFMPFFTTKGDGMGLGLSISRSIIESHGGRLWAAPNRGPGVTFGFTLPVVGIRPGGG